MQAIFISDLADGSLLTHSENWSGDWEAEVGTNSVINNDMRFLIKSDLSENGVGTDISRVSLPFDTSPTPDMRK